MLEESLRLISGMVTCNSGAGIYSCLDERGVWLWWIERGSMRL